MPSTKRSIASGLMLAAMLAVLYLHHRSANDAATIKRDADVVVPAKKEPDADMLWALCFESGAQKEVTVTLARLRATLLGMPQREASDWIRAQLNAGRDAQTGVDLAIGKGRLMNAWPSLRVFLLDVLAQVDPMDGAQAGRDILAKETTADEWAVALRNVAQASGTPEDTALLKSKCAELLRNTTWRREAAAGYLQAFDVIVHTRHTELAPELLNCTEDTTNQAVRRAAFHALDKLTQSGPGAMLPLLTAEVTSPATGPMLSNMIARADVSDAAQRAQVEAWLREPRRTLDELQGFAGTFPNANQFVSDNLLTLVKTIEGADLAKKDTASLAVLDEWLNDSSLARSHPFLRETRSRLLEWTAGRAR